MNNIIIIGILLGALTVIGGMFMVYLLQDEPPEREVIVIQPEIIIDSEPTEEQMREELKEFFGLY